MATTDDCTAEKTLTSEYIAGLIKGKKSASPSVVRMLVGAVQRGDKGFQSGAAKAAAPKAARAKPSTEGD